MQILCFFSQLLFGESVRNHIKLCFVAGEVLRGDRIVNTMYKIKMGTPEPCKILCKESDKADAAVSVTLTAEQGKTVAEMVRENYFVHL